MLNDLTLYVNTHSIAGDCWVMFFRQLEKHWPNHPPVVIACDRTILWGQTCLNYSRIKKFSNQYLAGLCFIETPFTLTLQEDFLLYADVHESIVKMMMDSLYEQMPCARLIDSGRRLNYSMQASVWLTSSLKQLYASIDADTPWDAEAAGDVVMKQRRLECSLPLDDEMPMRGRDHRDSFAFPYIATALTKGKWNSEYRTELEPLHTQYGIDAQQRGWSA